MDLDIDMDDAADAVHEPIMEEAPRGEDILVRIYALAMPETRPVLWMVAYSLTMDTM
jgi:hypothetical protein